jgi:hypothetical protein
MDVQTGGLIWVGLFIQNTLGRFELLPRLDCHIKSCFSKGMIIPRPDYDTKGVEACFLQVTDSFHV